MAKKKSDRGAAVAHDHGIPRSSKWRTIRNRFVKVHPFCSACGPNAVRLHLEVHHIIPFHICSLLGRPGMELDPRNLIVLCEDSGIDHHLLVGHLDSFKSSNPDVKTAASVLYFGWTEEQIRADESWKKQLLSCPKEWKDMTDAEKQALRLTMDQLCPV